LIGELSFQWNRSGAKYRADSNHLPPKVCLTTAP